jgi:hypothetical protein
VHEASFGQTVPHAPQFCGELRAASQPSAGRLLQSAKPVSQRETAQLPLVHWPSACASAHARPHAPQSDALFSERSQPSDGSPLQSPKPGRHTIFPHTPASHVADATFGSIVQLFLQLPQLAGFDRSASQPLAVIPSQSARPDPQTKLHLPSSQLALTTSMRAAHTLLQPPQVAGKPKSASQPSATLSLQLPRPSLQRVI